MTEAPRSRGTTIAAPRGAPRPATTTMTLLPCVVEASLLVDMIVVALLLPLVGAGAAIGTMMLFRRHPSAAAAVVAEGGSGIRVEENRPPSSLEFYDGGGGFGADSDGRAPSPWGPSVDGDASHDSSFESTRMKVGGMHSEDILVSIIFAEQLRQCPWERPLSEASSFYFRDFTPIEEDPTSDAAASTERNELPGSVLAPNNEGMARREGRDASDAATARVGPDAATFDAARADDRGMALREGTGSTSRPPRVCVNCHALFQIRVAIRGESSDGLASSPAAPWPDAGLSMLAERHRWFVMLQEIAGRDEGASVYTEYPLDLRCEQRASRSNGAVSFVCRSIANLTVPYSSLSSLDHSRYGDVHRVSKEVVILASLVRNSNVTAAFDYRGGREVVDQWLVNVAVPTMHSGAIGGPRFRNPVYSVKLNDRVFINVTDSGDETDERSGVDWYNIGAGGFVGVLGGVVVLAIITSKPESRPVEELIRTPTPLRGHYFDTPRYLHEEHGSGRRSSARVRRLYDGEPSQYDGNIAPRHSDYESNSNEVLDEPADFGTSSQGVLSPQDDDNSPVNSDQGSTRSATMHYDRCPSPASVANATMHETVNDVNATMRLEDVARVAGENVVVDYSEDRVQPFDGNDSPRNIPSDLDSIALDYVGATLRHEGDVRREPINGIAANLPGERTGVPPSDDDNVSSGGRLGSDYVEQSAVDGTAAEMLSEESVHRPRQNAAKSRVDVRNNLSPSDQPFDGNNSPRNIRSNYSSALDDADAKLRFEENVCHEPSESIVVNYPGERTGMPPSDDDNASSGGKLGSDYAEQSVIDVISAKMVSEESVHRPRQNAAKRHVDVRNSSSPTDRPFDGNNSPGNIGSDVDSSALNDADATLRFQENVCHEPSESIVANLPGERTGMPPSQDDRLGSDHAKQSIIDGTAAEGHSEDILHRPRESAVRRRLYAQDNVSPSGVNNSPPNGDLELNVGASSTCAASAAVHLETHFSKLYPGSSTPSPHSNISSMEERSDGKESDVENGGSELGHDADAANEGAKDKVDEASTKKTTHRELFGSSSVDVSNNESSLGIEQEGTENNVQNAAPLSRGNNLMLQAKSDSEQLDVGNCDLEIARETAAGVEINIQDTASAPRSNVPPVEEASSQSDHHREGNESIFFTNEEQSGIVNGQPECGGTASMSHSIISSLDERSCEEEPHFANGDEPFHVVNGIANGRPERGHTASLFHNNNSLLEKKPSQKESNVAIDESELRLEVNESNFASNEEQSDIVNVQPQHEETTLLSHANMSSPEERPRQEEPNVSIESEHRREVNELHFSAKEDKSAALDGQPKSRETVSLSHGNVSSRKGNFCEEESRVANGGFYPPIIWKRNRIAPRRDYTELVNDGVSGTNFPSNEEQSSIVGGQPTTFEKGHQAEICRSQQLHLPSDEYKRDGKTAKLNEGVKHSFQDVEICSKNELGSGEVSRCGENDEDVNPKQESKNDETSRKNQAGKRNSLPSPPPIHRIVQKENSSFDPIAVEGSALSIGKRLGDESQDCDLQLSPKDLLDRSVSSSAATSRTHNGKSKASAARLSGKRAAPLATRSKTLEDISNLCSVPVTQRRTGGKPVRVSTSPTPISQKQHFSSQDGKEKASVTHKADNSLTPAYSFGLKHHTDEVTFGQDDNRCNDSNNSSSPGRIPLSTKSGTMYQEKCPSPSSTVNATVHGFTRPRRKTQMHKISDHPFPIPSGGMGQNKKFGVSSATPNQSKSDNGSQQSSSNQAVDDRRKRARSKKRSRSIEKKLAATKKRTVLHKPSSALIPLSQQIEKEPAWQFSK